MPIPMLPPLPETAPTLTDLRDALRIEINKADERYKRLTMDVLVYPSVVYDAKKQVQRLHAALEVLHEYAYGWPRIAPEPPADDTLND